MGKLIEYLLKKRRRLKKFWCIRWFSQHQLYNPQLVPEEDDDDDDDDDDGHDVDDDGHDVDDDFDYAAGVALHSAEEAAVEG